MLAGALPSLEVNALVLVSCVQLQSWKSCVYSSKKKVTVRVKPPHRQLGKVFARVGRRVRHARSASRLFFSRLFFSRRFFSRLFFTTQRRRRSDVMGGAAAIRVLLHLMYSIESFDLTGASLCWF